MRWRRACLGAINCVSNFRDKNSKLCDSVSPRLLPEIGAAGMGFLFLHRVAMPRLQAEYAGTNLLWRKNCRWRGICSGAINCVSNFRDRNSILHANCNSCDRKASSVPAATPVANLMPLKLGRLAWRLPWHGICAGAELALFASCVTAIADSMPGIAISMPADVPRACLINEVRPKRTSSLNPVGQNFGIKKPDRRWWQSGSWCYSSEALTARLEKRRICIGSLITIFRKSNFFPSSTSYRP